MRAILLSLMLLWSSEAFGQYVNVKSDCQQCTPLGCRVFNQLGSAVCIGVDSTGRAIHLTAAHCVTGARHVWGGVSGEWKPVTLLGSTGARGAVWTPDIAICADSNLKVSKAAPLADRPPSPGDDVVLHSFRGGDGRQYRARAAKVTRIDENAMELSIPSENGDSGGAVIWNGKLVGIISATDARTTTATTLGPIRSFLQRTLGAIPDCGKPSPAPVQPMPQPAPVIPPMTEADPAPLPNVPNETTVDVKVLVGQMQILVQANTALVKRLEALENKPQPEIPIQLFDEETGKLVDERRVKLGDPIQLGNRKQKVK